MTLISQALLQMPYICGLFNFPAMLEVSYHFPYLIDEVTQLTN